MVKLGQPENQINALGVHYANCVNLNYPGARIRAMMACTTICASPIPATSQTVSARRGGYNCGRYRIELEGGGVAMEAK
jgi:hypothetical protein